MNHEIFCLKGYKGKYCNETCGPFEYGVNCAFSCLDKCASFNSCDSTNGKCLCYNNIININDNNNSSKNM